MNWKAINNKYPKSFDLFFNWFKDDPKANMTKKGFLEVNNIVVMGGHIRELYDFFNTEDIVFNGGFFFAFLTGKAGYGFTVMYKVAKDFALIAPKDQKINSFNNLKQAEEQAFLRAFEILEEKLTDI